MSSPAPGFSAAHFLAMVRAEARAIYGRGSARLALVMGLLCGLAVALAFQWMFQQSGMTDTTAMVNGNPISQMVEFSGGAVAGWALRVRNFFVLPLVLLLATAGSLAGELGDQTLREVLVRPVPRWSVLAAKVLVLTSLAALSLLLTLVPALGAGAAMFGVTGPSVATPVEQVLLGYAASMLSDLGLIALGLLASTFVRSVGGVVVSMMLFLMGDMALRAVLQGMVWMGATGAETVQRAMPGNALACWEGYAGGSWDPAAFIGMAVILLIGLGGTALRFQRMDVP